jgi:glycopeptide antibiotics resistance protein
LSVVGGVERWIPVVVVSIAVLPLSVLAVLGLNALRVRRGGPTPLAMRHSIAEVGMIAGTVPWIWMILTPLPGQREVRPWPVLDIVTQIHEGAAFAFFQIVGNLLVFAAFGFFAPIRWSIRPLAVVGIAALASATVEGLQYVLDLGRVTSVDDVLLNATGAGLAALAAGVLARRVWASAEPDPSVP